MTAIVYFIAGCIAGLAIAWYFTKQYYEKHTITMEEHQDLLEKELAALKKSDPVHHGQDKHHEE